MKYILLITLVIFIGVPLVAAQIANPIPSPTPTTAAQTNLEQEFKQLLQERADGKRRGDKEFIERTTAETRILFKNLRGYFYVARIQFRPTSTQSFGFFVLILM